jgi:hypothetical protein
MIKELEVFVSGHRTNYEYYKKLGYDIFYRKSCLVKVKDLMPGSSIKISSICDVCGSENLNSFKDYYVYTNGLTEKYYCNKCNKSKSKETCLKRYGVENPMQSNLIKDRLRKSVVDKYGVDHFSKTDIYKEKFKNTCLERYGVDNPFESDLIKEKIIQTNIKNIGVSYPMQSSFILKKSIKTCQDKYGKETYSQTEECKEKVKNTNIERYGVDNYSKTDEFISRSKKTNLEKYGTDFYTQTDKYKTESKLKKENSTKVRYKDLLFNDDYEIISYKDYNFIMTHKICGKEFNIDKDLLYSRNNLNMCICTECFSVNSQCSFMEIELQDFLKLNNINFLTSDREVLSGKELDIYIPEYKLAIEMNGVYWHNELYKDDKYHLNKTIECNKLGIQLIHIWEDDWKFKKDIVKSIILNRIGLLSNKIFARKCLIRNVSSSDARSFLNNNHIQGFSPSQIKLGLYYKNELVSLMTFGWRYTNGKREFELIRFCNKINYSIIGAASKLFHNLLKTNSDEIISYADISLFNGGLYEKLGFKKVSLSQPNYFWVVDGIRKHRFNYNKKKLIKEGFDGSKTEIEIMHERGYFRIWGCGQEKWIYNK